MKFISNWPLDKFLSSVWSGVFVLLRYGETTTKEFRISNRKLADFCMVG